MELALAIPDDLAQRLSADGQDLSRRALEAFALEEWRAERITRAELRRILGFATRAALQDFLAARGLAEEYGPEEWEQDKIDLARLGF